MRCVKFLSMPHDFISWPRDVKYGGCEAKYEELYIIHSIKIYMMTLLELFSFFFFFFACVPFDGCYCEVWMFLATLLIQIDEQDGEGGPGRRQLDQGPSP